MASTLEERVYAKLLEEPTTPNEVVNKIGMTHKTAQRIMMEITLNRDDVGVDVACHIF